jgi:single-stranded DNA-binding protein
VGDGAVGAVIGEQVLAGAIATASKARLMQAAVAAASGPSRVVVVGRLQRRAWTAEDGNARSTAEVVAEELGPSLRWATATTRATRSTG